MAFNNNPFFEYYSNLWHKQKPINFDNMPTNHYMYLRFISIQYDGLMLANTVNKLYAIPEWAKSYMLYYSLPKRYPRPKKMYASTKPVHSAKKLKILHRICKRFNIQEKHAEQVFDLLEMQEIHIN